MSVNTEPSQQEPSTCSSTALRAIVTANTDPAPVQPEPMIVCTSQPGVDRTSSTTDPASIRLDVITASPADPLAADVPNADQATEQCESITVVTPNVPTRVAGPTLPDGWSNWES